MSDYPPYQPPPPNGYPPASYQPAYPPYNPPSDPRLSLPLPPPLQHQHQPQHHSQGPPMPAQPLPPIHYPERGPPPPIPERDQYHDHGRGHGRNRGPGRRRRRSPDGRQPRRGPDRDSSNAPIEERLARERQCRTLFVRNVQYDADSSRLQQQFASYGDVKTCYDMVSKRGMMFVTYFDLRAAQKARDAMHDTPVNDRPIDVHYSLPKDDERRAPIDAESNQGSLEIIVRGERFVDDHELWQFCQRYGDIKSFRALREPNCKLVEFFDSRAAVLMVNETNHKPFARGTLELIYRADEPEPELPPPPATGTNHSFYDRPRPDRPEPRRDERDGRDGRDDRRRGGNRRNGEGPGYGEVRSRGFAPSEGRGGRRGSRDFEPRGGGYDDDRRGSGGNGPPHRYSDAPPPATSSGGGDLERFEQARKVQQLLEDLGKAGGPSGPPMPQGPSTYSYQPPGPPPPSQPPMPNYSQPAPSYAPYQPPGSQPGPPGRYAPDMPNVRSQPDYSRPPPPPPPTQNYPPPAPYQPHQAPPQHHYAASPPSPRQHNYPPPGPPGSAPYQPYVPPGGPPQGYGAPAPRPPPPTGPPKDVGSLLAMLQQNRQ